MSRDFIGDPWNIYGVSTIAAWRYRCDPCGEAREILGDAPLEPPFCAQGHRMVETEQPWSAA